MIGRNGLQTTEDQGEQRKTTDKQEPDGKQKLQLIRNLPLLKTTILQRTSKLFKFVLRHAYIEYIQNMTLYSLRWKAENSVLHFTTFSNFILM